MRLKVLHLPYSYTANQLRQLFGEVSGTVKAVYVVPDTENQEAMGFVTMGNHRQHIQAIKLLNGRIIEEKAIEVIKSSRRNMHDLSLSNKPPKTAGKGS